jgi:hypothetical protein
VGSLTLHLDEDNWNKASLKKEDYDRVNLTFEPLIGSGHNIAANVDE